YVYATLPANTEKEINTIGLIAHMDTSSEASDMNIKASIVRYEGGDILLNEKENIFMTVSDYPYLEKYIGQHLIVSDGTTLIGADDKAGIAEIMTALEKIIASNMPHGTIKVAFTPDEEIGRGADHFDVEGFGADYAYTVDGGALGELEYENFNAAGAKLTVHGLNVHPGSAKDIMKNAILMANQFISMLPPAETPAHTTGYEGFYHVCDFAGDETTATVSLIVRDHDRAKFEARKAFLVNLCDYLNGVWGDGRFVLEMRDSYYNMKEKVAEKMSLITNAEAAMRQAGVEPIVVPIRGGTDGARLSYMGILCPNLSTGGANFHGVHEYIPVKSMHKMVEVLVNLVTQK
ncbi:MAG: peptidase T, partial [Clostridia bacterium]|nr:peptidase T [Clostridia bacterium]